MSKKNATITNIIATNGTCMFKKGEMVNEGDVLIEGKMYYTSKEPVMVHASGMVKGIVVYDYEKEYDFEKITKEYTKNKKRGISFYINDREIEIKYLPKKYIYDKLISDKRINLFGNIFGISYNEYIEYIENKISYTYDELEGIAKSDFENFLVEFLKEDTSRSVVDKLENIQKLDYGIKYSVKYYCEENIGEFKKIQNEN